MTLLARECIGCKERDLARRLRWIAEQFVERAQKKMRALSSFAVPYGKFSTLPARGRYQLVDERLTRVRAAVTYTCSAVGTVEHAHVARTPKETHKPKNLTEGAAAAAVNA